METLPIQQRYSASAVSKDEGLIPRGRIRVPTHELCFPFLGTVKPGLMLVDRVDQYSFTQHGWSGEPSRSLPLHAVYFTKRHFGKLYNTLIHGMYGSDLQSG